ncbi:MAG TPA: hypothetical protein VKS60_00605 [Stellaceae bacterium]|nr:hypothetical protein [Stellaceae bacterium]
MTSLRPTQLRFLVAVASNDGVTLWPRSQQSRTAAVLAELGLVDGRPHGRHPGFVHWRLTEAGLAWLADHGFAAKPEAV